MSLITYFKATLPCNHGGHVGTAWIPSKLGDRGATYGVGDCPGTDIHPREFADTSFVIRTPTEGEPTRVLMSWTCETCGLESFVEVAFGQGCVLSITPCTFDLQTLDRVHYIAEDLDDVLESLIDESPHVARADLVSKLRQALERGRRWGR
jgi:hypothetical protein